MLDQYRRSLQAALRQNSSAFGFSVMITTSFAMLVQFAGQPEAAEGLLFGLGAVASFTLLDLLATQGFKRKVATEPPEVITHASSLSFLSVGLGIGIAIGLAELITSIVVWPLAAFVCSSAYIVVVGAELGIAERTSDEDESSSEQGSRSG